MPDQISFSIGDLPLTMRWDRSNGGWKCPPAYAPFSVLGGGGIQLDLSVAGDLPEEGIAVFDNAPIWSLYRSNAGALFHLFGSYPDLKRTLLIPDGGDRARLVFRASDRNPFVGPSLELLMITQLARRDGAILHGCGVSVGGRGVLFAGESGAGKSTLSRLWAQKKGVAILSDDRVIVRRQNGALYLYGTPWHGEEAFAAPGGVPLERVFFIRHGQVNDILKLSAVGAVREMLKCSFPPLWDAGGTGAALELFHAVATAVPCAELAFVPDPRVIDLVMP